MKKIQIIFAIYLVLVSACAKGNNATISENHSLQQTESVDLPEIPSSLTTPEERADYLILHYWDNMDFRDTIKSHDRDFLEQSFVNFISVMPYASSDKIVVTGFSQMLDKAAADKTAYAIVNDSAEDYLYNPNSPMLSEDLYILYLTALTGTRLTEAQLARVEDRLEMVSKNRTGTKATDFMFMKPDGTTSSLYKSLPSGDTELMLIFFDPECENCEEVLERIQENESIEKSISEGQLEVLAVYSGDETDAWRKKAATLPESWTIGINQHEIEDNDLYFLPGLPTIYILSSDGTVKAKDIQL